MAWNSLADFFAVGHNCDNWTLQKAVIRCAAGRYRESLCEAAYDWQPTGFFHCTLKRIMIAEGDPAHIQAAPMPKPLTRGQITPAVTRVRKELEAWLCEHYTQPERPAPPPLQINTLWDIFNATDRYDKGDILGGVWHAMYGDYGDNDAWKPAIQWHVRWHTANDTWERQLERYILAEKPDRPTGRTTTMYNIARRIKVWLKHNSTFCPAPTLEKTHG